ncbi:MAG: hypothetical protein GY774_03575 [Planctomycetes bacterium]|nr:hypothetical protein [Planctomycetota bacterium]
MKDEIFVDVEKWGRIYDEYIEQGFDDDEAAKMVDAQIEDERADYGEWLYEQRKDKQRTEK